MLRASIDRGKEAVAQKMGGLDLSGFADWSTWYDEEARRRFGFGAAELDLGLPLGESFEVSGAFVGTPDDRFWGVYILDWHPFGGGSVAPRGRLWAEKGFHIQVGRFDVPFGND